MDAPNPRARRVTQDVLAYAAKHDLDSGDLILGLADVIGITAGTLDRQRRSSVTLNQRLDSLIARIRQKHAFVTQSSPPPLIKV